jgi:hypothetical protein
VNDQRLSRVVNGVDNPERSNPGSPTYGTPLELLGPVASWFFRKLSHTTNNPLAISMGKSI